MTSVPVSVRGGTIAPAHTDCQDETAESSVSIAVRTAVNHGGGEVPEQFAGRIAAQAGLAGVLRQRPSTGGCMTAAPRKSVLIVDDCADLIQFARRVLEPRGLEV